MRLIAPFGFYGWGNIGDEASLQGFARLTARVDPRLQAWIGSRNSAHCRRAEPSFRYFDATARRSLRRHWAWRTADAMVVAGGTPIADALGHWPLTEVVPLVDRASARGLPVAFVGTGTEHLRHEESKRLVADVLGPKVACWTVRSDRDRSRLLECGVAEDAVVTAADMAWGLEPVSRDAGARYLAGLGVDLGRMIVGVNVNMEGFVRKEHPRLLQDLAGFLDSLVETHHATILFLCNEVREGPTFDLAASRELIASMRHPERTTIVPNEYWLPQVMMSLIACCRFTVSTRYHFCLFSALQGIPFLAVERSTKVADLSADLGWPSRIGLREVEVGKLVARFGEMAERRPEMCGLLDAGVPRMRERSHRNELALQAVLGAAAPQR